MSQSPLHSYRSLDAPFRGDLNVRHGTYSKKYSHNGFPFAFLLLLCYHRNGSTGVSGHRQRESTMDMPPPPIRSPWKWHDGFTCACRCHRKLHAQSSKTNITGANSAFHHIAACEMKDIAIIPLFCSLIKNAAKIDKG